MGRPVVPGHVRVAAVSGHWTVDHRHHPVLTARNSAKAAASRTTSAARIVTAAIPLRAVAAAPVCGRASAAPVVSAPAARTVSRRVASVRSDKPKDCNGLCLLSSECCDSRDCAVAEAVSTASRQCLCPEVAREICGGACRAICETGRFVRDPNTCTCCVLNDLVRLADPCCSGRDVPKTPLGRLCKGRDPGESCSFNEQCASEFCLCGIFGCACQA